MKSLLNIKMPDFKIRRDAFDKILKPDVPFNSEHKFDWKKPERFACGCCGFPTLVIGGNYEMCTICEWEEENYPQDIDYGGGPNGPYSLFQSRENVEAYGCMYGPDEIYNGFKKSTKPKVLNAKRELIRAYLKLLDIDRDTPEWVEAWEEAVKHEVALNKVACS